jgi:hypothetical protein
MLQYSPEVTTHEQPTWMCSSLGLERPLLFPNFASRMLHRSLSIRHQDIVFLYGKEQIAKVATRLRTLAAGHAH